MKYPGGKSAPGVAQRIISQMPPHDLYVEPFLGGGAVMAAKRPALVNVGVDLDGRAVDRWRKLELGGQPGRIAGAGDAAGGAAAWRFIVGDGVAVLAGMVLDRPTVVYADPPYVRSTRTGGRLYRHELSDADHDRLLRLLLGLPCFVLVSGYRCELYDVALRDWRRIDYLVKQRSGRMVVESLWLNFAEPAELHDYRYVGRDFRERERIRRRQARWLAMLRAMPARERNALLWALAESRPGSAER